MKHNYFKPNPIQVGALIFDLKRNAGYRHLLALKTCEPTELWAWHCKGWKRERENKGTTLGVPRDCHNQQVTAHMSCTVALVTVDKQPHPHLPGTTSQYALIVAIKQLT